MKKLLILMPLMAMLLASPIHSEQSSLGNELIQAIEENNTIKAKELLPLTGPNVENEYGDKPLLRAAQKGNIEIVRLLIEAGADINTQNIEDDTALIFASVHGHTEVAKALINADANVDIHGLDETTALIEAAGHGYIEIVKALIKAGADVNAIINADENGSVGWNALAIATANRKTEVVQALVKAGADVKTESANGLTVLNICSSSEIKQILINAGAKFNSTLNAAARDEAREILNSAMITAEDAESIHALIKAGADVKNLKEALFDAIFMDNINNALALIKAGADVNAKDEFGSALDKATSYCTNPEIIKALIKAGADVNAQDKHGFTALRKACHGDNTNPEIVKILIEAGADVNTKDENGSTLLSYCRNPNIRQMLIAAGAHE